MIQICTFNTNVQETIDECIWRKNLLLLRINNYARIFHKIAVSISPLDDALSLRHGSSDVE